MVNIVMEGIRFSIRRVTGRSLRCLVQLLW